MTTVQSYPQEDKQHMYNFASASSIFCASLWGVSFQIEFNEEEVSCIQSLLFLIHFQKKCTEMLFWEGGKVAVYHLNLFSPENLIQKFLKRKQSFYKYNVNKMLVP